MKQRLDQTLVTLGLVPTRSQAESYIKLGDVKVNGRVITKSGEPVGEQDKIVLAPRQQYVSRAALKLASVTAALNISFKGKTILDVGSSTGGFTDYALKHGAVKSIAVEVGTNQLHPSLHGNPLIELHEQTDIRDFKTDQLIEIVVADVSFISLREILPSVARLCTPQTAIIAMVKPQFEAGQSSLKHKGVIKNDRMRRDILHDFETWTKSHFKIVSKADSQVSGSKGNVERFYHLQKLV
ncbi:MAG TPA: TlyA family RNA methyltransferase [Candidatus Saccharimonadales bacterium]|jgi:23S rRNA (cytidine1920-2'-O)/16S rRNA (cytidine1409-2'-O)-methyltransferase